jgi:hypothetical protein
LKSRIKRRRAAVDIVSGALVDGGAEVFECLELNVDLM